MPWGLRIRVIAGPWTNRGCSGLGSPAGRSLNVTPDRGLGSDIGTVGGLGGQSAIGLLRPAAIWHAVPMPRQQPSPRTTSDQPAYGSTEKTIYTRADRPEGGRCAMLRLCR